MSLHFSRKKNFLQKLIYFLKDIICENNANTPSWIYILSADSFLLLWNLSSLQEYNLSCMWELWLLKYKLSLVCILAGKSYFWKCGKKYKLQNCMNFSAMSVHICPWSSNWEGFRRVLWSAIHRLWPLSIMPHLKHARHINNVCVCVVCLYVSVKFCLCVCIFAASATCDICCVSSSWGTPLGVYYTQYTQYRRGLGRSRLLIK